MPNDTTARRPRPPKRGLRHRDVLASRPKSAREGWAREDDRRGTTGVLDPPKGTPQTYARNPQCGLPAIATYLHAPCPDESPEAERRRTVEMYRRTFVTVTAGIQVVDFGNAMVAGFGAGPYGRLFFGPPTPGVFFLTTTPSTYAQVRDITISWDPFSRIALDGPSIATDLRSYAHVWSALLAGQITIETEPYATVLPIGSAIKGVAGIDAYWTIEPTPPTTTTLTQLYYVHAVKEATHRQAPVPLGIDITPDSAYRVLLAVPNRPTNYAGGGLSPYPGFVYVWTGVIEVLQENNTRLTSFSLPEGAVPFQ